MTTKVRFRQPFLAWVSRNWNPGATFDAEDLAALQEQWTNSGGLALDELHRRLSLRTERETAQTDSSAKEPSA